MRCRCVSGSATPVGRASHELEVAAVDALRSCSGPKLTRSHGNTDAVTELTCVDELLQAASQTYEQ